MKYVFFLPYILAVLGAGNPTDQGGEAPRTGFEELDLPENLLSSLSREDLHGFKWFNDPEDYSISEGILSISPGDTTDFFNDASTGKVVATAPLL